MKQRFKLAGVCLLLGAISTTAVAWGCMLSAQARRFSSSAPIRIEMIDPTWPLRVPPGWEDTADDAERRHGVPGITVEAWDGSQRPDRKVHCVISRKRSGWPMRALLLYDKVGPSASQAGSPGPHMFIEGRFWWLYDGVRVRGGARRLKVPVLPTLGFAFDTAFYGAIWFSLITGCASLRSRLRVRRGKCASCGYDLRGRDGDQACPECGLSFPGPRRNRLMHPPP